MPVGASHGWQMTTIPSLGCNKTVWKTFSISLPITISPVRGICSEDYVPKHRYVHHSSDQYEGVIQFTVDDWCREQSNDQLWYTTTSSMICNRASKHFPGDKIFQPRGGGWVSPHYAVWPSFTLLSSHNEYDNLHRFVSRPFSSHLRLVPHSLKSLIVAAAYCIQMQPNTGRNSNRQTKQRGEKIPQKRDDGFDSVWRGNGTRPVKNRLWKSHWSSPRTKAS